MSTDDEFIAGKKPGRVYFSKEFSVKRLEGKQGARYASRILEGADRSSFISIEKEVVLRTTRTGRQQIKALFLVDDRGIRTLTLQRFSADHEQLHEEAHFAPVGKEISQLLDLAVLVRTAQFEGHDKVRLESTDLETFQLTPEAARTLLASDPKLVATLLEERITDRDIVALAYRRRELDYFARLLKEPNFFDSEKKEKSVAQDERLWQIFFERNPWIFGYGLFYVFTSTLEQKRLEQIVAGTSLDAPGKRVDALLKSRGRISSLCFAEIKTHTTRLLDRAQYRPDVWAASRDLARAIAQVQKTVDRTEQLLGNRLDTRSPDGSPTGESAFLIRPRSIVVAGNLSEFRTDQGINEPQFASFELFRRQLVAPEILTFDELYERARFIVESTARHV